MLAGFARRVATGTRMYNRREVVMKFNISIESSTAAMVEDPEGELSRILDVIKSMLADARTADGLVALLRDSKGNSIGLWEYAP